MALLSPNGEAVADLGGPPKAGAAAALLEDDPKIGPGWGFEPPPNANGDEFVVPPAAAVPNANVDDFCGSAFWFVAIVGCAEPPNPNGAAVALGRCCDPPKVGALLVVCPPKGLVTVFGAPYAGGAG